MSLMSSSFMSSVGALHFMMTRSKNCYLYIANLVWDHWKYFYAWVYYFVSHKTYLIFMFSIFRSTVEKNYIFFFWYFRYQSTWSVVELIRLTYTCSEHWEHILELQVCSVFLCSKFPKIVRFPILVVFHDWSNHEDFLMDS